VIEGEASLVAPKEIGILDYVHKHREAPTECPGLFTAAWAMAVKYSAALENGPWLFQPSDNATDNLSMMGSPVSDMEEMEPM
jgi:hypothetical protein